MLGKLLKYEFRATGRTFLPMYAVLLVMSFVARLLYSGQLQPDSGSGPAFVNPDILTVIVSMVMVALFTAVWIVTFVVIIQRFWKNLLGREGYLMNVLPVSPWEHVFSKMIVATVWSILSVLASLLALWIMLGGVLNWALNINWSEFVGGWNEAWAYLRSEGASGQAALLIAQVVIVSILSVFASITTIYAAMCIGQTANKHRVWASIGAYFGIDIATSVVGSWLISDRLGHYFPSFGIFGGDGPFEYYSGGTAQDTREILSMVNTELLIQLLFAIAIGAILFFVTQWLMKKKLNLQ